MYLSTHSGSGRAHLEESDRLGAEEYELRDEHDGWKPGRELKKPTYTEGDTIGLSFHGIVSALELI